VQSADGVHRLLEQQQLFNELQQQPDENPGSIDLEQAIHIMEEATEISVRTPQRPGKG